MAKTPDNVQLLQLARGKIEHEHKWIQQRVSWNLASTSFLLAAYTALVLTDRVVPHSGWLGRLLLLTIPLLGLAFCCFVIAGLWAAWIAEDKAVDEWESLSSDNDSREHFPEIHSMGAALVFGKIASWGTTAAAIVVWLALLVAPWFMPLGRSIHPWR